MKFSFVIIAYNEEENISSCIEHIEGQRELNGDYEIIVVDDGSTDSTNEIVKELAINNKRLKLVSQSNRGRGYGRYTGSARSSGKFIAMVDADILLPYSWLSTCLKYIKKYDVVGGIAVPDGDVSYVHNKFGLIPKVTMGSTTITGNNGLYKRQVISKVNFNKNLRDGEDVDFNNRLLMAGFSEICIPNLTVDHVESKTLSQSVRWLYQSGGGATRMLKNYKKIRLADVSYFGFLACIVVSIFGILITGSLYPLYLSLIYLLLVSALHIGSKFYYRTSYLPRFACAILTDCLLVIFYYAGRTTQWMRL